MDKMLPAEAAKTSRKDNWGIEREYHIPSREYFSAWYTPWGRGIACQVESISSLGTHLGGEVSHAK